MLGGRENESLPAGIFYRMGMPSSRELTYDLVTCTHSLLDLPDEKTRLTTVDKLWRKTGGYLVLIENGTNAGFQVRKGKNVYLLFFTCTEICISYCSRSLPRPGTTSCS